jgi:predicted small lipoprotein YifL
MNNASKLLTRTAALASLAILAACGKYGELEPKSGSKAVPVAYGQEKSETPDELLKPAVQARPGRSVELLRRSQRRQDDEFDLPPGTQPKVDEEEALNVSPTIDAAANSGNKPKE